ncbi:MAG: hypothetical protein H0X29_04100 [Parachlamydiaceae bacterium]|nr:hypothetical protein [Parachlamydiaceae bacterium]
MPTSVGPRESYPIFLENLSKDSGEMNVILDICGANSRYKIERMQKIFQKAMQSGFFKKKYFEHESKLSSYNSRISEYSETERRAINQIIDIYDRAVNELGCLCEDYSGLNGPNEVIEPAFEKEFYRSFEEFALKTRDVRFQKQIEKLKNLKPEKFEDIGKYYEVKINPGYIPTPPSMSCNIL